MIEDSGTGFHFRFHRGGEFRVAVGLFSVPAPPFRPCERRGFLYARPPFEPTMTSTPWTLGPNYVRLNLGPLAAVIAPEKPEQGLHSLTYDGVPIPASRLLALSLPCLAENEHTPLAERFVRNSELVVAYAESAEWPMRVDARFRALPGDAIRNCLVAVEAIVSVCTQQMGIRSELTLDSRLNASETLRLVDASKGSWVSVSPGGKEILAGPATPRCVLFRLNGGQMSYVEMLGPADSGLDEVQAGDGAAIRHRVFPHSLEKGVMVRIRVKGALVARQQDAEVACQLYRNFADEEPPLGS
jgi:hypothetical protein